MHRAWIVVYRGVGGAPISSKISRYTYRRVCSVMGARCADFKQGARRLRRLCVIQLSWKVLLGNRLLGRFSATFAGSLLTNVSARKDLIFPEVIEDFVLYDNYLMHAYRRTFKNFSKCFRIIRGIRTHM